MMKFALVRKEGWYSYVVLHTENSKRALLEWGEKNHFLRYWFGYEHGGFVAKYEMNSRDYDIREIEGE